MLIPPRSYLSSMQTNLYHQKRNHPISKPLITHNYTEIKYGIQYVFSYYVLVYKEYIELLLQWNQHKKEGRGSNPCRSPLRVPKQELINPIPVLCVFSCCPTIPYRCRMPHLEKQAKNAKNFPLLI